MNRLEKQGPALLKVEQLQVELGPHGKTVRPVDGIGFEVPAGQTTMLLGRNGAGKTTTLRTIMGLWTASAGQVRFDGREVLIGW